MSIYIQASQAVFRLPAGNSSFITQLAASGKSRDLPTAIALGIAATQTADLPAGRVDSPEEFFLQQSGVNAADAVNVINELCPVDYRTALAVAKDLYLVRYELAYKPFDAFGYNLERGITAVFGLNNHIPSDILECIRCNAKEITAKVHHFKEIIQNLKKD